MTERSVQTLTLGEGDGVFSYRVEYFLIACDHEVLTQK